jgi:hypothetical protein
MSFGHERLDVYRATIEQAGRMVREASTEYAAGGIDTDDDSDTDPEKAQRAAEHDRPGDQEP